MQNGRCVEQNACRALFAPRTLYPRLLDSEPPATGAAGRRCPAAAAVDLSVAFPIRKGILRRVVDHNRVVKNISFQLRAGNAGAGGRIGIGKSTTGLALLRLIASRG
jgi:microcin C transport system ATP-binding protein